jgi:cyanophycinase
MTATIKPIFLFADSQILFWQSKEGLFLNQIKELLKEEKPDGDLKASYIGASNGDDPNYYDIFLSAMWQMKIYDCKMIPSKPQKEDYEFLDQSDFILLAGGDVEKGWNIIKETEIYKKVVDRYHNGAIIAGVSAGAVQLGLRGWIDDKIEQEELFETFQLVPAIIDVHDESDWNRLRKIVKDMGEYTRGFGIPAGGGAVYHPDWSFEAIRHHLVEFSHVDKEFKQSLIVPSDTWEKNENNENKGKDKKLANPDTQKNQENLEKKE